MTSLLGILLRLARCTSGSAALEGALVIPMAIALMAGGAEFGSIYTTAMTADESMRDAARYLARVPRSAICDWGLTNAKNVAVYGNVAGTGSALITGWATTNITLQQPSDCTALPDPIILQLQATVPYTGLMLPVIGFSNSFTFPVQHEERWIGE
jgi:Flp pilus assembly protein TadG